MSSYIFVMGNGKFSLNLIFILIAVQTTTFYSTFSALWNHVQIKNIFTGSFEFVINFLQDNDICFNI